jgi:tRNA (mo5U34)-methyltransferase
MKASNPLVTEAVSKQIERLNRLGWYHSIELPDGSVIEGLQTVSQMKRRVAQFDLPDRMDGLRVLDIGAWDGWFTFEMERRGASVTAIDLFRNPRFEEARTILGSKAEYLKMGVYDLDPKRVGQFDIVLFLGVLYHLKHPLLGLEKVCSVAKGLVCVESFVSDHGTDPNGPPTMEFYENTELCGQFDNWVGPNTSCLLAFCRTAGFVNVELKSVIDQRAHIQCDRQWRERPGSATAPILIDVENATSRDSSFQTSEDPYVSLWFKTTQPVQRGLIRGQFGDFAASAVSVHSTGGDGWHAVFKLPPGLASGWTPVSLRLDDSQESNRITIGIDVSEDERWERSSAATADDIEPPVIEILADGYTWERNIIQMRPGAAMSLWVRNLPEGMQTSDIQVRINGTDFPSSYVSAPIDGLTQVNVLLPNDFPDEKLVVSVVNGQRVSASREAAAKEISAS